MGREPGDIGCSAQNCSEIVQRVSAARPPLEFSARTSWIATFDGVTPHLRSPALRASLCCDGRDAKQCRTVNASDLPDRPNAPREVFIVAVPRAASIGCRKQPQRAPAL